MTDLVVKRDGAPVRMELRTSDGVPRLTAVEIDTDRILMSRNISMGAPPQLEGDRLTWGSSLEFEFDDRSKVEEFLAGLRGSEGPAVGGARLAAENTVGSRGVDSSFESPRSARHWRRAATSAQVVEVATYVFMALGTLGGLIIAFQRDPACQQRFSSCTFNERLPLFWTGLGISFGVAFQGLVVVMLTAYIQARAADATAGK